MDWTALLLVAFFFLVTAPSEGRDQGVTEHYRKHSWGVIAGALKRLGVAVNPVPSA